jgi:hypothetical protein
MLLLWLKHSRHHRRCDGMCITAAAYASYVKHETALHSLVYTDNPHKDDHVIRGEFVTSCL